MAEVKLWKKQAQYTNKDGEERTATNFFVDCGGIFVPVEVKYFEDKETGRDDHYRERKTLLTAFADTLPDRDKDNLPKKQTSAKLPEANKPIQKTFSDKDIDNIPF